MVENMITGKTIYIYIYRGSWQPESTLGRSVLEKSLTRAQTLDVSITAQIAHSAYQD